MLLKLFFYKSRFQVGDTDGSVGYIYEQTIGKGIHGSFCSAVHILI